MEQAHIASREGGAHFCSHHMLGGGCPPPRLHHMLGGGPDPPQRLHHMLGRGSWPRTPQSAETRGQTLRALDFTPHFAADSSRFLGFGRARLGDARRRTEPNPHRDFKERSVVLAVAHPWRLGVCLVPISLRSPSPILQPFMPPRDRPTLVVLSPVASSSELCRVALKEKADKKQEHNALSHMTSDPTSAIV